MVLAVILFWENGDLKLLFHLLSYDISPTPLTLLRSKVVGPSRHGLSHTPLSQLSLLAVSFKKGLCSYDTFPKQPHLCQRKNNCSKRHQVFKRTDHSRISTLGKTFPMFPCTFPPACTHLVYLLPYLLLYLQGKLYKADTTFHLAFAYSRF